MTKEHLKEILKQGKGELRLTDEQLAEVRRRRGKKNPQYVSMSDALNRFGARRQPVDKCRSPPVK
jgi:hypothetical protein